MVSYFFNKFFYFFVDSQFSTFFYLAGSHLTNYLSWPLTFDNDSILSIESCIFWLRFPYWSFGGDLLSFFLLVWQLSSLSSDSTLEFMIFYDFFLFYNGHNPFSFLNLIFYWVFIHSWSFISSIDSLSHGFNLRML